MTVTIYSNAAITAAYASSRYTATVNGESAPVLSVTETTEYSVPSFWTYLDVLECSFLKFATDEEVEVELSPDDINVNPITSVYVTTTGGAPPVTVVIANGVATLTIQAGTQCRVETNNERGEPIYISALAPVTTPTGGTVDTWDGTQSSAVTGRTLVFPAGITDIPGNVAGGWSDKLLPVATGANVFIPGDAWVIGSFDHRGRNTYTVGGHGTLSGEFETNAFVEALPNFDAQYVYTLMLGDAPYAATISGITCVKAPFYALSSAANFHSDLLVLTPYHDNSDGIKPIAEIGGQGRSFTVDNCALWVGDDAIALNYWRRSGSVTNCLVSTSASSCFLHSYTSETYDLPSFGFAITVSDCNVRSVCDYYFTAGSEPGGGTEGGAVIQCWLDGYRTTDQVGVFNVTYRNLRVLSDDAGINCTFLWMGSRRYPWGAGVERDGYGVTGNWLFDGVTLSHVPAEISKLRGLDGLNAPNGVEIKKLTIGGVPVGVRNHATYFDIDEECFNVTFDGVST